MAQFVTDASGATWWLLEPMQVAFFLLAGEIIQVRYATPWVRCASGNVFLQTLLFTAFVATVQNIITYALVST